MRRAGDTLKSPRLRRLGLPRLAEVVEFPAEVDIEALDPERAERGGRDFLPLGHGTFWRNATGGLDD